jgi:hypothetical protein
MEQAGEDTPSLEEATIPHAETAGTKQYYSVMRDLPETLAGEDAAKLWEAVKQLGIPPGPPAEEPLSPEEKKLYRARLMAYAFGGGPSQPPATTEPS